MVIATIAGFPFQHQSVAVNDKLLITIDLERFLVITGGHLDCDPNSPSGRPAN